MTTYYLLTSEGKLDSTTTVQPTNPSVLYTDVAPDDDRQTWDFVNSVWFWTKDTLKQLAADTRSEALQGNVTVNGNTYPSYQINMLEWFNIANLARTEDPSAQHTLIINTSPVLTLVTLSNSDLVTLVDGLYLNQVATADVLSAVFADIDNNTITNKSSLDSAWASLVSGYSAPSVLPTIANLNTRVTALENA